VRRQIEEQAYKLMEKTLGEREYNIMNGNRREGLFILKGITIKNTGDTLMAGYVIPI
jgi:hypothetical protein